MDKQLNDLNRKVEELLVAAADVKNTLVLLEDTLLSDIPYGEFEEGAETHSKPFLGDNDLEKWRLRLAARYLRMSEAELRWLLNDR